MKFPYMYYGYRDDEGKWDYWSGKYIIFEGLGPQTIEGTNYQETIRTSIAVENGKTVVRGNSTLATMDMDMGAYILDENQKFTYQVSPDSVNPTSGFVLANASLPSLMPQRIKSIDLVSGEVTTESNVSTSTPTIAGDNQMLVYNIAGGVGIIPVVEQQVSIYNAAGQLVTSQYLTDEVHIPLPTGIYLISGVKDQFKTVVK